MKTLSTLVLIVLMLTSCEKTENQNVYDFNGFKIADYTRLIGQNKEVTASMPGTLYTNPAIKRIVKDIRVGDVWYSVSYYYNENDIITKINVVITSLDPSDFYYHYSYELARIYGTYGTFNFQARSGISNTYSNINEYYNNIDSFGDIASYNMYWYVNDKTIRFENIGIVVLYIY